MGISFGKTTKALLAGALLLATAGPAGAETLDEYLAFNAGAAQCAFIGYTLDQAAAGERLGVLLQAEMRQGKSQEAVMQKVMTNMQDAMSRGFFPVVMADQVDYTAMEAQYNIWSPVCDRYANDSRYSGILLKGSFQTSGKPQTFFELIIHRAGEGDVADRQIAGDMYRSGYRPDPDHEQAIYWYGQAAALGGKTAAFHAATLSYKTGEKVTAARWIYIAVERGYEDDTGLKETVEQGLSAEEIALAHTQADEWLKANPAPPEEY